MWTNYALIGVTVLCIAAALFCWHLYKDAIRREIATSEMLCAVLLSPDLHFQLQDIAYERIGSRFPTKEDHPSKLEIAHLQQELMALLGNVALSFVTANGGGATLRRILTGPFIVSGNPDKLCLLAAIRALTSGGHHKK